MAYWVLKSEPGAWSWEQMVAAGNTEWDGVRNHQACRNLAAMRKGDRAFFYHSGKERQIVGIVEVSKTYCPDPTDPTGRFGMVHVRAVAPLPRPVTLREIKAEPRLSHIALVRQSRLSVLPLNNADWTLLCRMGKSQGKL
jgi:predicted RNA-binding protein with PUA-like domain